MYPAFALFFVRVAMIASIDRSDRRTGENIPTRIFWVELVELLHQISNTLVFRLGYYDLYFHDLVPALAGLPGRRRAFFAQGKLLAAVRRRRNAHLRAAVDRGHFDFCAERRLADGDRHDRVEIVSAAIEERMRRHFCDDIEIARRSAADSRIAAAGDSDTRAGIGARRNAHVERFHFLDAAFAPAIAADGTLAPGAAAAGAGDLKSHLAAHLGRLSGAVARGADLFIARRDALAVADAASIESRETQFFHRAAHGFGECDVDLIFEVGAGLVLVSCGCGSGPAEKLAEEVAETRTASGGALSGPAAKIEAAEIEMNIFGRNAAIAALRGHSALARHVEPELV